jgi:8-oxo-dGTP pyrophosphatase MutT (NUDIX family)
MEMENLNWKLFHVSVTGIVRKDGKYLICKRSPSERAFPGKWCVPGGKTELGAFLGTQKDTSDHWFRPIEKTLEKELLEETGLRTKGLEYVSSLLFIRPDGIPTIVVSMAAEWLSGEVTLDKKELVDFAWVDLAQAKGYDLIENIYEQMEQVEGRSLPRSSEQFGKAESPLA